MDRMHQWSLVEQNLIGFDETIKLASLESIKSAHLIGSIERYKDKVALLVQTKDTILWQQKDDQVDVLKSLGTLMQMSTRQIVRGDHLNKLTYIFFYCVTDSSSQIDSVIELKVFWKNSDSKWRFSQRSIFSSQHGDIMALERDYDKPHSVMLKDEKL